MAKSTNKGGMKEDASPGSVHIRAPRGVVLLACVLAPVSIMAFGAACFWLGGKTHPSAGVAPGIFAMRNNVISNATTQPYNAKPGPWGDLECQPIIIEVPDEYLSVHIHEAAIDRWFFKGYSAENLTRLLNGAVLSAPEKGDLLNAKKWEVSTNGIYINPSQETILSLTPAAREKIYTVLSQFLENPPQEQAYHWHGGFAESIFNDTTLSQQTRSLIKKLSFAHGKLVMFADLPTVLRLLPAEAEKVRLEKALSRVPTLLIKLVVTPESDIPALIKYWGIVGNAKDVQPVLEAAAKLPGGTKISIRNLLPPLPTARLYTYPFPIEGVQYDCHWTSFNFFTETPNPPTNDGNFWKQKLDTEYYPVNPGDPRYGDLVMLVKKSGMILHSCVFIADNIVYTKNGAFPTAPWVLMTIPEVVDAYTAEIPETDSIKLSYYRRKSY